MTDKISQKKAVVDATLRALGTDYDNTVSVLTILTKSQIAAIKSDVLAGITVGTVVFNKEFDHEKLKKYISSMVSNHFRKARELNGGSTYKPSATGTKRTKDPDDEKLKALKLMLSKYDESSDEYAQINTEVNARKIELEKKKQENKKYKIDVSVLPDNLKDVMF